MDAQIFPRKYYPILKQHFFPIVLGFFGLIFLVYGSIALFGSSESASDVVFESGNDAILSSETSAGPKASQIVVDVEGAVLKPGVHNIPSGSRIEDTLIAAGGFSLDADRDWVTKNLNLAIKVTDGTKIYIPRVGENVKSIIGGTGITGTTGSMTNSQININTAGEDLLDSLPGVGPVTVQKIIYGRPYTSIDDLLSKKIVGSKVFEEIREKITVY